MFPQFSPLPHPLQNAHFINSGISASLLFCCFRRTSSVYIMLHLGVVSTVLSANGHFACVTPAVFIIFVDFRGVRSKIPCFVGRMHYLGVPKTVLSVNCALVPCQKEGILMKRRKWRYQWNKGFAPQTPWKWRKWRMSRGQRHGLPKAWFVFPNYQNVRRFRQDQMFSAGGQKHRFRKRPFRQPWASAHAKASTILFEIITFKIRKPLSHVTVIAAKSWKFLREFNFFCKSILCTMSKEIV